MTDIYQTFGNKLSHYFIPQVNPKGAILELCHYRLYVVLAHIATGPCSGHHRVLYRYGSATWTATKLVYKHHYLSKRIVWPILFSGSRLRGCVGGVCGVTLGDLTKAIKILDENHI